MLDLVDVKEAAPSVLVDMRYFAAHRKGAVDKAYVRPEVGRRLGTASRFLPRGYHLVVWDAWRSYETQKSLYDEYFKKLLDGGMSVQQASEAVLSFVSFPSKDPKSPFVHNTGGAVDLTVEDAAGRLLNMGTEFDDFSEKAHTFYFQDKDKEIHKNRMLLYGVMYKAGFTNLSTEWWHFDYGDRFWEKATGQPARFFGVSAQ